MCQQEAVLQTLKKTSKVLSNPTIVMFEAQVEDFKNMNDRMHNVEKKVDTLIIDVSDVKDDVNKILFLLENKKPPIFDRLIDNKYFWIILIIIASSITGFTAVDSLRGL